MNSNRHPTYTALQNICHQITRSFNNLTPTQVTFTEAQSYFGHKQGFDSMNKHKIKRKPMLTINANNIIKFIENYVKKDRHVSIELYTKRNQHWNTTKWNFVSNIIMTNNINWAINSFNTRYGMQPMFLKT